jgi:DNA-binding transcriptional ArsR family regulator
VESGVVEHVTAEAGEAFDPPGDEIDIAEVLHALSDPVRLQIVHALDVTDQVRACVDIPLPVGKSTASHHYKVLRQAGVVSCREEGTRHYYTLRRADLDARFPGLLDAVLRALPSG